MPDRFPPIGGGLSSIAFSPLKEGQAQQQQDGPPKIDDQHYFSVFPNGGAA